ncbi:MAG: hypothetical protein O6920_07190 [Chloroflexi bacterium]|nr:hypothetical protein [Chloroflexota bacterium]
MSTIEEFEKTWLHCAHEAKALEDMALSGKRYEGPAGEQPQHLSSDLPIEERFELLDLAQGKQRQSHEAYWRMIQLSDRGNAPEAG